MKKIFINAGHGGNDSGAYYNGNKEKDYNLKIALACTNYLNNCDGVVGYMSENDINDKSQSSSEILRIIKEWNPDVAIDIHNNAGGGNGCEIYQGKAKLVNDLALKIEEEIKAIDQNSRGIKTRLSNNGTDYYYFIRETTCPALIIECAFIDTNDFEIINNDLKCKKMGIAIAKGIIKHFNLSEKTESQESTKKVLYKVQVGAFANKNNAINLSKELKRKGYDNFIVESEV